MVTSAVALSKPTAIQAAVVRQQSMQPAAYTTQLTPATLVSSKQLPHSSLLPLHLCASTLASAPQHLTAASSFQSPHYSHSHSHSASAPSLPALLLSANNHAASILSSSLPATLHPSALSLSFTPSATSHSLSCLPLSSAYELTSSLCRSKQRLARKAELARQSRKRKKSAIAHMADTIRQLRDDNARLRQRLATYGVYEDSRSSGSGSSRGKRKADYRADKEQHRDDKRRVKRDEEAEGEMSEEHVEEEEEEVEDDECPSELTNSSDDEESDEVLPGAAELGALSPSSTPSSVASSLLSAASSIDLPLTALIGKRGRM